MQKIEELTIIEDTDLQLLNKHLVALHYKIGKHPQRIVVVICVEDAEQELPEGVINI